jgi:hypothetical protein
VLVLLAAMGAAMVNSALQESQTWDEAAHLAAGYSYLLTGDYRLNPEHPPLAKILAALPLIPLGAVLNTQSDAWKTRNQVDFGDIFLYDNRVPADTMLMWARSVTSFFALCLGLAIALWTRRRFGAGPALVAVFLYSLDPNFLAHGHYVTNDVLFSLLAFLACIAWDGYLRSWRLRYLLGAALTFAAAMVTKFSAPFLLPVFLLLFSLQWWRQRGPVRRWLGRLALSMALIFLVTVLAIVATYWSEIRRLTFDDSAFVPLTSRIERGGFFPRMSRSAGKLLHLPAYSYLVGFEAQARHQIDGHTSYVLGRHNVLGAWYYFPVAFAVKTPTAVLFLLLLALAGGIARLPRSELWVLVVPPGVYFLFSMYSHINIGLRHILPIYPFLFVLIAASLFRLQGTFFAKALPFVLCGAVTMQAAETIRIHPHYLAFFNTISGGPASGRKYLVDSNLDWGQDLKHLKKWVDTHGNPPMCVTAFGSARWTYYGVSGPPVPATWDTGGRANLNCIVAVSATVLQDVYVEPGRYQWLRERQPFDNIGYSIYLYDCRKKPASPTSGTNRQ